MDILRVVEDPNQIQMPKDGAKIPTDLVQCVSKTPSGSVFTPILSGDAYSRLCFILSFEDGRFKFGRIDLQAQLCSCVPSHDSLHTTSESQTLATHCRTDYRALIVGQDPKVHPYHEYRFTPELLRLYLQPKILLYFILTEAPSANPRGQKTWHRREPQLEL